MLIGGNFVTFRQPHLLVYWPLVWPFAFILCTVIASRIWHGHDGP